MIRILVTGEYSYIGKSFKNWMHNKSNQYIIDTISTRNNIWKERDFSSYDVILQVAGIAHVDAKADMEELYYQINRDLTIDIAKKAKSEGVKQFIFMSSMIVFGESNTKNRDIKIHKNTRPRPSNFYGNSKLQAEEGLLQLEDQDTFKIVIVRTPMIYGRGSKGNYPRLAHLAKITPIFPNISNERSMLYIDNLCEFLRIIIEEDERGIFHPQNREYVNTTRLVQTIAKVTNKKLHTTRVFNPIIKFLCYKINLINKIFGSMAYDYELSNYKDYAYCVYDFEKSINLTEGEEIE